MYIYNVIYIWRWKPQCTQCRERGRESVYVDLASSHL